MQELEFIQENNLCDLRFSFMYEYEYGVGAHSIIPYTSSATYDLLCKVQQSGLFALLYAAKSFIKIYESKYRGAAVYFFLL